MDERFTVRWFEYRDDQWAAPVRAGFFAVYDGNRRITMLWPTLAEAERHRDNIAQIYARYGW